MDPQAVSTNLADHHRSAAVAAGRGEELNPADKWFSEHVAACLNPDRKYSDTGRLTWMDWAPGVIRTTCGTFTVVRVFIPGHDGPDDTYLLLQDDPASTRAYGADHLGFSRGCFPRLDFAFSEAERLAWQITAGDSLDVPADYPAERIVRFRQDGRVCALAAIRKADGRLLVELISMCRTTADETEAYVVALLEITDLAARRPKRKKLRRLVRGILESADGPLCVDAIAARLAAGPHSHLVPVPLIREVLTDLVDRMHAVQLGSTWHVRRTPSRAELHQSIRQFFLDAPDGQPAKIGHIVSEVQRSLCSLGRWSGAMEIRAAAGDLADSGWVERTGHGWYQRKNQL